MNATDLKNLSVTDRLRMMEALWSSLQRDGQQDQLVPDWHSDELAHRIACLDAGQEPMMPLAQAKNLLQQDIAQRKSTRAA